MVFRGIAISGKSRAGKDALAAELNAQLSDSLTFSLGRTATYFAETTLGTTFQKPWTEAQRKFVIGIAQAFREYDPDYWVNEVQRDIDANKVPLPIVTDVRQKNEFDHFYNRGYFMIRLECSVQERVKRGANLTNMGHVTETDLDDEERFHVRIDTTNTSAEAVAAMVIAALKYANMRGE